MRNDILLSVIIPVFNVEKYLEQCIMSVLNQSVSKEIILVDDGSTDSSPAICDRFDALYSEVTVLHKQNGGLASTRNAGLPLVNGKYLFFLDSDDWVEPEALTKLVEIAEKKNVDFVRYRLTRVCHSDPEMNGPVVLESVREIPYGYYDRQRIDEVLKPKMIVTDTLTMGPVVGSVSSLYKTEFLRRHNIKFYGDIRYSEDMNFSANAVNCASAFFYTDFCPVYNYRYNPESISRSFRAGRWESLKRIIAHFEADYSDDPYFKKQLENLSWFCVLQGLNEVCYLNKIKEKLNYRLQILSDPDFPKLSYRWLRGGLTPKLRIRMALIHAGSYVCRAFLSVKTEMEQQTDD